VDGTLPVLICGAGPTGLTLALELSRFGVPFRIIDRSAAPAANSRALAVQPRTLELLEACRVTERLLMFARQIHGVEVRDGGRPIFSLDMDGMPTPYPFVASVGQETTERTMIVCLHEHGVDVERELTLTAVRQDTDGVDVELVGPDGIERLRCRFLAACDGAHSSIRHLLDVPFAGHAIPERFALADVCLETSLPTDHIGVTLDGHGGMFMLAPLADTWRAIVESPEELPDELQVADVQRLIDAHAIPARVTRVEWASSFAIHQRKVAQYVVGRTFFLGDAAHVHSPLGGQGMNTGIGDAVNLAWKLALVVNDDVDPKILQTYHDERDAVGRALLRATASGNRIVFNPNGVVRTLRNTVVPLAARLPHLRERLREVVAGLRIAYLNSPLSVNDKPARRGLRAGMRVRGHRPAGYRPQPMLIADDGGTPATIVIRPDGYAGYVADGTHAGGASTYLRNVIGLREVSVGRTG
jgi:3-(3-hydroxy-phenyl)propionate hydroxylase